ncbi:MAG: VPLPA-CTERM sorting domain-containing protein [Gammaproteobacteria bacterium]
MSRQYLHPASALILGVLLSAMPGAVSAISVVEYGISATSTTGVDGQSLQVPVNLPFSVNAASGGSSASISYSPGVVGLTAATNWPSGDPNTTQFGADHSAGASVGIFDRINMERPAGNTDLGASLTFSITLSGSLAETNGFANWLLQEASFQAPLYRDATFALVQPLIRIEPVDGAVDGDFGSRGQSLPVTLTAARPATVSNATDFFLFDVPYDMRWRFAVNANGNPAGPGQAGSAAANLGNTIVWLGITARDSQGNIIEGLQFTSESGYDWARAAVVPLPASAWLLVTALGAVGLRAARRVRGAS